MSHIGAILRVILLTGLSLSLAGVRFLVWPVSLVSRKADRRLRRAILQFWARCFARIARIRTVSIGPIPKPPFFLVANHVTYFDMLVLVRETGCIFVSREDVKDWPVVGLIARSLYIIFIDRTDKRDTARVNRLIEETIREGDGIVVFAESRVSCGMDVEPFKSPLLQPAVALNIPVHYASISYRTPEGGPTEGALVSWWRPEPFYVHLYRFLRYPGATATIHFGETPMIGSDRKLLAQQLHTAVRANFKPLRQAAMDYAGDTFPVENTMPPGVSK